MKFDIVTIFPAIFDSYFAESIVSRARKAELMDIKIHNLRDYTANKHKKVDDTPYGGGAGMILKIEPIYKCVREIISNSPNCLISNKISNFQFPISKKISNSKSKITKNKKTRVILFSAKGKKYTQADARRLSKYDNLILICGRYEGVDERVAEYVADEEISIGDYVLTGGEIPAMVLVDSITRLLPGVLGNPESLKEESFNGNKNLKLKIKNLTLEYPQYTKPEEFMDWKVPEVLLSGNHGEIEKWRLSKSKIKSQNAK
ncbi:MAG: tRNA (guanine37-N1)-methyltransferase [Patescibacteria group bacterium]|nr:tRNA (guanine37-N1)-methyltransferase [Patescibacteria group bacterium]